MHHSSSILNACRLIQKDFVVTLLIVVESSPLKRLIIGLLTTFPFFVCLMIPSSPPMM